MRNYLKKQIPISGNGDSRIVSRHRPISRMNDSNGVPLPENTRNAMETRFGYEFSSVRLHSGSRTAANFGAKAFTWGNHIFFSPGNSHSDQPLLAHELTHVVQQATGEVQGLRGSGGDVSLREVLESRARYQSKRSAGALPLSAPIRPMPSPISAPAVLQFDFEEDVERELHRLPSAEEEELTAVERHNRIRVILERRARLRDLFDGLSSHQARLYHRRFRARRRGDALSNRLHDILADATIMELLHILESKFETPQTEAVENPQPPEQPSQTQTLSHITMGLLLGQTGNGVTAGPRRITDGEPSIWQNGYVRSVYFSYPANIDMVHFFAASEHGEALGDTVEFYQRLTGSASADNPQDYYSNMLGADFRTSYYSPNGLLSEQLERFFSDIQSNRYSFRVPLHEQPSAGVAEPPELSRAVQQRLVAHDSEALTYSDFIRFIRSLEQWADNHPGVVSRILGRD